MSDVAIPNKEAQQGLLKFAKLLAHSNDVPKVALKVPVEKIDAALAGMDIGDRMLIKTQLLRAGVIG